MQHRQLTKRFIQVSGNTQINQQNTQQNEEISINRIGMDRGKPRAGNGSKYQDGLLARGRAARKDFFPLNRLKNAKEEEAGTGSRLGTRP
jgi:hypothetical protein